MFKFIHAADLHLDSPLKGLEEYENAPKDRIKSASRRAFEQMVDLAVQEEADFVLLAGDLYDGDWKDFSTGLFLGAQAGRLERAGIQVIAVLGNHDANSKLTAEVRGIKNLRILSHKRPETLILEDLGVAIHGRSFYDQKVDENLAAEYPTARPGLFNIGLLHTSLNGRPGHANYAPCTRDDLVAKGYQYWALGHVHGMEVVSENPWIVFPGCIQGRHIRETGPKGCMLVTVDEDRVDPEFRELDVVRWAVCHVDISGVAGKDDAYDRVRRALRQEVEQADGRLVAARVVLEGTGGIARELRANPMRVGYEIRVLGSEVSDDDLWIEKVRIGAGTEPVVVQGGNDPMSDLLGEVMDAPVDTAMLREKVISDLKRKIPERLAFEDMGLDRDDRLQALVREAKDLLAGRLASTEGENED